MSAFLRIRAHGGDVTRDGWRFTLRPGRLSPEAIRWVKANMQTIRREVWCYYDEWEERAAIREFDGGMTREDAEAAAYAEFADA